MSARVVATHVWPSDIDEPVSVDVLELDWGGPVGDRHHGERMASDTRQSSVFTRGTSIRNHRQVSIVDTGELAQIATAMGIPRIDPGVIADNICTEGIDALTALPRMTRLVFRLRSGHHAGGTQRSVHDRRRNARARLRLSPRILPQGRVGPARGHRLDGASRNGATR